MFVHCPFCIQQKQNGDISITSTVTSKDQKEKEESASVDAEEKKERTRVDKNVLRDGKVENKREVVKEVKHQQEESEEDE